MKIVTDCAADLSDEEAQALDITVAPLFINFAEQEINSSELTPDEFYQRLEEMYPRIPTTAQPSIGDFADIYHKLIEKGEEVLSIHISSGLSGTINSAQQAAGQLAQKLVHVIDSLTLSGGQRFQVLAAVKAVQANWDKSKILHRLEEIRKSTEVIYTLDTLTYLAHGGRIGRVQALASSLLNIKPLIHVDLKDGKYSTLGKTRTIDRALEAIANHLAEKYDRETPVWVSVLHGRFQKQADALAALLQEKLNIAQMEILRISPVLGVHTGPGIVGATVVPMHLIDDIS